MMRMSSSPVLIRQISIYMSAILSGLRHSCYICSSFHHLQKKISRIRCLLLLSGFLKIELKGTMSTFSIFEIDYTEIYERCRIRTRQMEVLGTEA